MTETHALSPGRTRWVSVSWEPRMAPRAIMTAIAVSTSTVSLGIGPKTAVTPYQKRKMSYGTIATERAREKANAPLSPIEARAYAQKPSFRCWKTDSSMPLKIREMVPGNQSTR